MLFWAIIIKLLYEVYQLNYVQSQMYYISWYEGAHTAVKVTKPLAIGNCNKLHATCETNLKA